jgi:hypothetical protein
MISKGKTMLKLFTLLCFLIINFSIVAQKASYYVDKTIDLNNFTNFYLLNCPLDAHDLTNPFIDKTLLNKQENNYFALYNELSLKNLTIIDGESTESTFLVNLYESSSFDATVSTPIDYKPKRIKGPHLILDIISGANNKLVWRGWINLKKIKSSNVTQKAIYLILLNFRIEPVIVE